MITFPPRDETLRFFETLEQQYVDLGRPEQAALHVDREGIAVWTQQYLLYRVNGSAHDTAIARVLDDIKHALNPTPPPALFPARVDQGRYRAGDRWFVPRFCSCFEAPWLILTGQEGELIRRLDRAAAARCCGIRTFGMLGWPTIAYSPRDAGYWTAQDRACGLAAERGLYYGLCFFCDAQVVVPGVDDRRAMTDAAAAFCREHPTVWFQCANEARKNGWSEADDPTLLELADRFRAGSPTTILSVSDPADGDDEQASQDYVARQDRIAPHADELVLHPSRKEDLVRFRRWVDHLKGAGYDHRDRWPNRGMRLDEPMGAASTRQPSRRDSSVVAHVAGALVGAMVGGYTYMHRPDEDDACPGLLESAIAADVPGSPDMRFSNATLGDSSVERASGFDGGKCRTVAGAHESWAVAYGRTDGAVAFRGEWSPSEVFARSDAEGIVRVWRATR